MSCIVDRLDASPCGGSAQFSPGRGFVAAHRLIFNDALLTMNDMPLGLVHCRGSLAPARHPPSDPNRCFVLFCFWVAGAARRRGACRTS